MSVFYQPKIGKGVTYLSPEESKHCAKVLRKSTGDIIQVTDGNGSLYQCELIDPNHKKCSFKILDSRKQPEPQHHIHIALSPTKSLERVEWYIEKSVEFGIQELSFIVGDNSERKVIKTDRLRLKSISAAKQSGNFYLPTINEPMATKNFLSRNSNAQKFICHVDSLNPDQLKDLVKPNGSYEVLVGPEGDFSDRELKLAADAGYAKVSLGPSRLRTETAGIAACHIINLINQ